MEHASPKKQKITQPMKITIFSTITNKDKSNVVQNLIKHSTPSQDFYLMIILAISMATLGLLLNSASIVIGSMLISPMLYAFLSMSLGFSISDTHLIGRSFYSIIKSLIIGVIVSALITLFMASDFSTNEVLSRISPSLAYAVVALIAGFAAAFTMTKPQLNEILPGIAISVAIVPPIAVSGIGLATLQWDVFRGASSLFLVNTIAIVAGSLIVFSFMNIYAKRILAQQTLKDEEKRVESYTEESNQL